MHSFAFIPMLLVLTQVFAAPTPTTPTVSIEARAEVDSELFGSDFLHTSLKARNILSNAERFARGLPPAPPKREHGVARRAGASPTPQVTKRGIIQVTNTANGQVIGFISKNSFSGAQYRYQASENDAQIVTFSVDIGATSATSFDITSTNSDITGFPLLGLVQGRDSTNSDIAPGSFHYGYIAGTNPTPAGSSPVNVGNSYTQITGLERTSESAVWSINLVTGALTPQWINTDGSKPTTFTFVQSFALYFGGDQAAFTARFPATVTSVAFTFLERP